MEIVHTDSLSRTLEALNEAFLTGYSLSAAQRQRAAKWLAGRHGLPGSYRNMFARTEEDFADGIRLFTGEANRTRGGTSHILGEEACRAIVQLRVKDPKVRRAPGACRSVGDRSGSLRRPGTRHVLLRQVFSCPVAKPSGWRLCSTGR